MVDSISGKVADMELEQNLRCYVNVIMQERSEISFKTLVI